MEASPALPADEKTRAASSVADRARAIVTALVADAAQRAAAAPLAARPGRDERGDRAHRQTREARQRVRPIRASVRFWPGYPRRAAILADAGVQKAFGDAVLGVAHESASPAAVQAAAAHLLLPEEIAVATGASPYRVSIDAAMRQAEEEHQRRVPATDEAAASPRSDLLLGRHCSRRKRRQASRCHIL